MIGILTFHRSHNYGSVFQTYALQFWLKKHNYENEVIDLYTEESKKMYKTIPNCNSIKKILRLPFWLTLYKKRKKNWYSFFYFQNHFLKLSTSTYVNLNELECKHLKYTTYITGSDQIWNTSCVDFNWAYFLAFVTNKCNKVAYAPSVGSIGIKEQAPKTYNYIQKLLKQYNYISVREEGSADFLEKITGNRPVIVIDPVFLIDGNTWKIILENQKTMKIHEHYILFYTLKHTPSEYEIVRKIMFLLKLPVIITNVPSKKELFGFKWKIEAGPWDFLHLIQHADLVLTSSFHGTAFSIIFEKLFYSINGSKDNRIASLLNSLDINERNLSLDNLNQVLSKKNDYINYVAVKQNLLREIQKSESFLEKALKGEKHGNLSTE